MLKNLQNVVTRCKSMSLMSIFLNKKIKKIYIYVNNIVRREKWAMIFFVCVYFSLFVSGFHQNHSPAYERDNLWNYWCYDEYFSLFPHHEYNIFSPLLCRHWFGKVIIFGRKNHQKEVIYCTFLLFIVNSKFGK